MGEVKRKAIGAEILGFDELDSDCRAVVVVVNLVRFITEVTNVVKTVLRETCLIILLRTSGFYGIID